MRRIFSIRILLQLATATTLIALLAVLATFALLAQQRQQRAAQVVAVVDMSQDMFTVLLNLRQSRGMVVSALLSDDPIDSATKSDIANLNATADHALDETLAELTAGHFEADADDIRAERKTLDAERKRAAAILALPKAQRPANYAAAWIAASERLVSKVEKLSNRLANEISSDDPFIAEMMKLKQIGWATLSDAGLDRLFINTAIVNGNFREPHRREYMAQLPGRMDSEWKLIEDEVALPNIPQALKAAAANADKVAFTTVRPRRMQIVSDLDAGRKPSVSAEEWLTMTAMGLDALMGVPKTALSISRDYAQGQFATALRNRNIAILAIALFCVLGVANAMYVFRGVVGPITKITAMMRSLAAGRLETDIPYEDRQDEIGHLARSLHTFRDTAVETERLRIAKEDAEQAHRVKSKFLANMSHELRTPLNAVMGFSEMMEHEIFGPLGDAHYKEYATHIYASGKHLLGLINDVLDMSKLEEGQLTLNEELVDLAAAVDGSLGLVQPQAQKAQVSLRVALDPGHLLIRADERRLRQILINLLSNAVKFTPEGGTVSVSTFVHGDGLAVAVHDTGIGISKEDMPKALEAFGQIDNSQSRKHEGTGLGLPIAKYLIELHGAKIELASEVGVGTTVTFVLPKDRMVTAVSSKETGGSGKSFEAA